jgi:hypothetical protein
MADIFTMHHKDSEINFDKPLQPASALQADKLSRKGFAETAANTLRKVPSSVGLVVSIEGVWGSGKTSVLAMIDAILNQANTQQKPLIVHFNPWLIGDKDALLRHFLSRIAGAIQLSDNSRDGKKVAKEIKAYSKAFDLVKLIPGAEPWASMVKSVVEAAGEATGAVAEYKTPDIEAYKKKVEEALRQFQRPIIVFIDDIDRLFPLEVFEMVRIIKAVGELPGVGYLLAWDSAYVSSALEKLGVPQAAAYLDKVVQVRMPIPSLSLLARKRLVNEALAGMDPEVHSQRFKDQDERLARLYHSGLRDMLEQPRDIARVFNVVQVMEPLLRGEIVFSDILGLALLSVKAPLVFELLRKNPRIFIGRLSDDMTSFDKSQDVIKLGEAARNAAYAASSSPNGARTVVQFLFPLVMKSEVSYVLGDTSFAEGNIAHPAKLAIALQLGLSDGDASVKAARRYLQFSEARAEVVETLTVENCNEFVELLGDVGKALRGEGINDMPELCLAIARLPDQPIFMERDKVEFEMLRLPIENSALWAVKMLLSAADEQTINSIAEAIAKDPNALSCAAEIVMRSYGPEREQNSQQLTAQSTSKENLLEAFSLNVLSAAKTGNLFEKINPGFILWTMAHVVPQKCSEIFGMLKTSHDGLEQFALFFLERSRYSSKGVAYSLPTDQGLLNHYCPIDEFKAYATERLKDKRLIYPAKAAWRSVLEGKNLYGVDGSEARR